MRLTLHSSHGHLAAEPQLDYFQRKVRRAIKACACFASSSAIATSLFAGWATCRTPGGLSTDGGQCGPADRRGMDCRNDAVEAVWCG